MCIRDRTSRPAGCAFASRCDCAMKICLTDLPEELPINENHRAACWTVSYTHLDVYKRQFKYSGLKAFRDSFVLSLIASPITALLSMLISYLAVSYTHLDVYKRQTIRK